MLLLINSQINHAFILKNADSIKQPLMDRGISLLTDTATRRLKRIKSEARKKQFVLARYLLSTCLYKLTNQYYKIDTLSTDLSSGQPIIPNSNLWCSISHSSDTIAVAVSAYGAIGIDIEMHCSRNIEAMVTEFFHPQEIKEFSQLPTTEKDDWFYRKWTQKEAIAKLQGKGISEEMLQRKIDSYDFKSLYLEHNNFSISCAHQSPLTVKLYNSQLLENKLSLQTLKWDGNQLNRFKLTG